MSGPASIPFSEYAAFASMFGIWGDYALELWEDVQAIDAIWLEQIRDDAKRESNKGH